MIMAENVVKGIPEGKEQPRLNMVVLDIVRLPNQIDVFQSDRPYTDVNSPSAYFRLHNEIPLIVPKR